MMAPYLASFVRFDTFSFGLAITGHSAVLGRVAWSLTTHRLGWKPAEVSPPAHAQNKSSALIFVDDSPNLTKWPSQIENCRKKCETGQFSKF